MNVRALYAQGEGFPVELNGEVEAAVREVLRKTPLEYAEKYLACGFTPIPIPFREKGPRLKDWQELSLGKDQLATYFSDAQLNIGVVLGDASNGLVDVDLDCPEAVKTCPRLLASNQDEVRKKIEPGQSLDLPRH